MRLQILLKKVTKRVEKVIDIRRIQNTKQVGDNFKRQWTLKRDNKKINDDKLQNLSRTKRVLDIRSMVQLMQNNF